ncbi:MAG: hypothetical protein ACRD0K_14380 [Egibacteraceae bacterium]
MLGKKDGYAYVAPTVKDAVDNTNRFVANGTGSEEWPRVLVLDDLDFFDVTGRPLEQIVIAGRLRALAVKDSRQEIRDRMRLAFDVIEQRAAAEPEALTDAVFDESWLKLPDEYLDFDAFAAKLVVIMAEWLPVEPMPEDDQPSAKAAGRHGFPFWAMHH